MPNRALASLVAVTFTFAVTVAATVALPARAVAQIPTDGALDLPLHEMTCNTTIWSPTTPDTPRWRADTQMRVRCYVNPAFWPFSGYTDEPDEILERPPFAEIFSTNTPSLSAYLPGGSEPVGLSIDGTSCVVGPQQGAPESGSFLDGNATHHNKAAAAYGLIELECNAADSVGNGFLVDTTRGGRQSIGAQEVPSGPVAQSTSELGHTPERSRLAVCNCWPEWPAVWPDGALPLHPPGGNTTEMPEVACRGEQFLDPAGNVRANLYAMVNNPLGVASDAFSWSYEWENPEMTPASTEEDPPTIIEHEGQVLRNVLVPTIPSTDVPDGGWWVRVRVERTWSDGYHGVVTDPGESYWDSIYDSIFGPEGAVPPWLITTLLTGGGSEATDIVVGPGETPYYFYSVPCVFQLDPIGGGDPEGIERPNPTNPTTGPTIGPWPDDGPLDPENPPDEGECEAPSGWGTINPVAWIGYGACSLGDLLGDLLSDLLDLLQQIVDWILGLGEWLIDQLIPTESITDMFARIGEAWGDTAIGAMIAAVGEFITDLGESFGSISSGGSCEGPPIEFTARGSSETVYPMDSCGDRAWVATLFRNTVGALFVLAAVYRIVAMVGRPFGIGAPDGEGEK